jgi:hypothetical protein
MLKIILNFYIDLTQSHPVTGLRRQSVSFSVANLSAAKRLWMIIEIAHLIA